MAGEDWDDPLFQEMRKGLAQEEVPRVVKIEEIRRQVTCLPPYTRRRPRQP